MALSPGYGETPLDGDEFDALLPSIREALGADVTKAAIFDLEQAVQDEVAADLLNRVLAREIGLDELLNDHFIRELHRRLYADIWSWGGKLRVRELTLGVAPELVAVELRTSLDTLNYRRTMTSDLTHRQLGVAVHAETVRIHPFADGNGRTTRLLADLVFVGAQELDEPELYDWSLDKTRYISLLREYDVHRDATDLAAFIGVRPLSA